ncbi:MAG: hypothetical protein M3Y45_06370, partial [Actinomycetota bacterium]|nr:hypothetical protein [Actinomycetota bacterium]
MSADGPARGCVQRAEGGILRPDPSTDAISGNLAFMYTWENLRTEIKDLKRRGKADLDRWVPVKTLVVVKAGSDVTVSVPSEMRSWLALDYVPGGERDSEIRFSPCDRHADPVRQREECEVKPYLA